ncbi:hypothetical protein [Elizabethkingia anophelis]|uniref:hypothetical protein n=1 Tax=Elizabethkingia anophelis TaxID=1117645 RepID=UPI003892736D
MSIKAIEDLLDEMPVLTELSKNIPEAKRLIIDLKIYEFQMYLEMILEIELESLKHFSLNPNI